MAALTITKSEVATEQSHTGDANWTSTTCAVTLAAGSYVLLMRIVIGVSSTSTTDEVDYRIHDGTSLVPGSDGVHCTNEVWSAGGHNTGHLYTFVGKVDPTGSTTYTVEFKTQDTAQTVYADAIRLYAIHLDDLDAEDYEYAETTSQNTLAGAYEEVVTTSSAGVNGETWLAWGMCQMSASAGAQQYQMRLRSGTFASPATTVPSGGEETRASTEVRGHSLLRAYSITGATQFGIDCNGPSGAAIEYGAVFALRLDAFVDFGSFWNVAESGMHPGTEIANVDLTPSATGDFFAAAFYAFDSGGAGREVDDTAIQYENTTDVDAPAPWLQSAYDGTDEGFVTLFGVASATSGALRSWDLDADSNSNAARAEDRSMVVFSLDMSGDVFTATAALTTGAATMSTVATFTAPTYTATAALTTGAATMSTVATFVPPTYSATAGLTTPAATMATVATFTAPTYSATAGLTTPAATMAASGQYVSNSDATATLATGPATLATVATFTAPTYTASAAITTSAATMATVATFTAPTYTATAALTAPATTMATVATFTATTYTATAALLTPAASLTAVGQYVSNSSATASLESPSATMAASGTFTAPTYTATAALVAPSAEMAAAAQYTTVSTATAALVAPAATMAASGSFSSDSFTATAALVAPAATMATVATFLPPPVSATSALATGAATMSSAATFTAPVFPVAPAPPDPVVVATQAPVVIEAALRNFLTSDPSQQSDSVRRNALHQIRRLAGNAIFAATRPAGSHRYGTQHASPVELAITLRRSGVERDYGLDGELSQCATTLQVEVHSRGWQASSYAQRLAQYVRLACSGYRGEWYQYNADGQIDNVAVSAALMDSERQLPPLASQQRAGRWHYRIRQGWTITHSQAVPGASAWHTVPRSSLTGSVVAAKVDPVDIEQALRGWLLSANPEHTQDAARRRAQRAVRKLVGNAVFSGRRIAPSQFFGSGESSPAMAITLDRNAAEAEYALDGETGATQSRLAVTCHARGRNAYLWAVQLSEWVRLATSGFRGEWQYQDAGGARLTADVSAVTVDGEQAVASRSAEGEGREHYVSESVYLITHEQLVPAASTAFTPIRRSQL